MYKNAHLLDSLAIAAAGQRRASLQVPGDYRQAIVRKLEDAYVRSPALLEIIRWRLNKARKGDIRSFQELIFWNDEQSYRSVIRRKSYDDPSQPPIVDVFNSFVAETKPQLISKFHIFFSSKDRVVGEDLETILQLLSADDPMLWVALFVEVIQEKLSLLRLEHVSAGEALRNNLFKMVGILTLEFMVKEVHGHFPFYLTHEFLKKLKSLGLVETAMLPSFLNTYHAEESDLGKAYAGCFHPFSQPKADDLRTVTHSVLLNEWTDKRSAYLEERERLGLVLGTIREMAGFGNFNHFEWNRAWITQAIRTGKMEADVRSTFDSPVFARIVSSGAAELMAYRHNQLDRIHLEQSQLTAVQQTVAAFKVLFEFCIQDPEQYMEQLIWIYDKYFQMTVALYNFETR